MELRHLRYFVSLAECLNFTRAAERVHVTQSTLSHQIAQLEQELGTALFERSAAAWCSPKPASRSSPMRPRRCERWTRVSAT